MEQSGGTGSDIRPRASGRQRCKPKKFDDHVVDWVGTGKRATSGAKPANHQPAKGQAAQKKAKQANKGKPAASRPKTSKKIEDGQRAPTLAKQLEPAMKKCAASFKKEFEAMRKKDRHQDKKAFLAISTNITKQVAKEVMGKLGHAVNKNTKRICKNEKSIAALKSQLLEVKKQQQEASKVAAEERQKVARLEAAVRRNK